MRFSRGRKRGGSFRRGRAGRRRGSKGGMRVRGLRIGYRM